MYPTPSQINPIHVLTHYLFKISYNVILPPISASASTFLVLQPIFYEFIIIPTLQTIIKGLFNVKLLTF